MRRRGQCQIVISDRPGLLVHLMQRIRFLRRRQQSLLGQSGHHPARHQLLRTVGPCQIVTVRAAAGHGPDIHRDWERPIRVCHQRGIRLPARSQHRDDPIDRTQAGNIQNLNRVTAPPVQLERIQAQRVPSSDLNAAVRPRDETADSDASRPKECRLRLVPQVVPDPGAIDFDAMGKRNPRERKASTDLMKRFQIRKRPLWVGIPIGQYQRRIELTVEPSRVGQSLHIQ